MKKFISLPFTLGLVVCVGSLVIPLKAKALMTEFTQREYLQWMVQLTGDDGVLNPSTATDDDYIKWAKKQKMDPKKSQKNWDLDAALNKELLAETLAQFFNLGKEKSGLDYVRLLLREGIALPDEDLISREGFVNMVDDVGFSSRTSCISKCKTSPSRPSMKPGKFKPPKPPPPKPPNKPAK